MPTATVTHRLSSFFDYGHNMRGWQFDIFGDSHKIPGAV